MVRTVVWTHKAIEERKAILDYWVHRNQSKSYSIKLNNLFIERIKHIALQPYSGRKTEDENVRVRIVKDYLIFYEIEEPKIIILTIWDNRRNPENLKIK
jgi:toxin YoeB